MKPSNLREVIHADMGRVQGELERLVRIPSISVVNEQTVSVRQCADTTAEILEAAGLHDVRLIEAPASHPAVFGQTRTTSSAPTVLLYAHYDVQPPGADDEWISPPFDPTERGGRLYGRGTSDDKCAIVMHAAALRAIADGLGARVKVLVEGEEEIGSPSLSELLLQAEDLLSCDLLVVADSTNLRRGQPTLTTSVRGLVDCVLDVEVLEEGVHSGLFGGPVPDALMVLAWILTSLHDEIGNVAIAGLRREGLSSDEYEAQAFIEDAGLLPGVQLIGEGPISERLWAGPAMSILGIDAPSVPDAPNQIVPRARAKLSLRLAPREDPSVALVALEEHLRAHVPWGAKVSVTPGTQVSGLAARGDGPMELMAWRALSEAWEAQAVRAGTGGSIPFASAMATSFPDLEVVMLGAGDEVSGAHSVDESVSLKELEAACLAEALLLQEASLPGVDRGNNVR